MLELKEITKEYGTNSEKVKALKGVSIKFRESEFVSILGQSGCGKTTLLNIIGGLDRYTSGDLIINGKSTKKFKERDWDSYRNYKIGFVFQSYNLISHQTILSNVELALTIGGVSKKERRNRAIKALEEVGLKDHLNKKPNQLSGGQMQRVAIARALVNNPDIILADEPTGALDTKTSIQVMEILKKISKDKLIIMVTHNPELAEKYSSRIIKILDGTITEDSNPIKEDEVITNKRKDTLGKTSMNFFTAFRLSLNNLLTKKGRTILVSFAGSIGIIGIALVQAVSNGFQGYVDNIQEETLTSYPLSIMQETSDVTSALLSMVSVETKQSENSSEVKEEQYISKMLSSLTANDLKSFKNYLEENYNEVSDDITSVQYSYSVNPLIYSKWNNTKISKLNPSDVFQSAFSSSMISSFSSSIYSQMIDDKETLNQSYDVLAGHWPEKYDELVIVLSEPNSISDLLVYYLGLRDINELNDIVSKVMSGETPEINNEPIVTNYDELMNTELKLIMPTDLYEYNDKYDIYEDMSEDEDYLNQLYENAQSLKIVGVVSAKEGTTTSALNPGVAYTSELINYIINYSENTDMVKKQINNKEVNVISGKEFNSEDTSTGLNFEDLVSIDTDSLQSAFNIKINQNDIENETSNYMEEIMNSISVDTSDAKSTFSNNLRTLIDGLFLSMNGKFNGDDIELIVEQYLNSDEAVSLISELENNFVIPKDVFKATYSGLLKGILQVYSTTYLQMILAVNPELDINDPSVKENIVIEDDIKEQIITSYIGSAVIEQTAETISKSMTEALVKKSVLEKVGELIGKLTESFASAFNVDQEKIAGAFKMTVTEEEITRIITSMLSNTKINAKTNLVNLGYQDKDEPTYISFYFNSFDGKEHFKEFIEKYNNKVTENGEEDKKINYTDTTGILMGSVKTIVNAVTYVLIAFVSISLVVSSIMIGIITYISVYERTKEIGILRAIGASKRNISSIFNAETFIIGLLSGIFGIGVTYAAIPVINNVLHHFTGNIPLSAILYSKNATMLVILSVVLTLIGGLIPAKAASKKDPVIALRTE